MDKKTTPNKNSNSSTSDKITKAGFVALIGKPNSGKSTLLNLFIGSDISIVTPKPQTTRRQVLGIVTNDSIQIIFIDTPGILKPFNKLDKTMLSSAEQAIEDCDLICVIHDLSSPNFNLLNENFIQVLKTSTIPKILLLNKVDLVKDKKQLLPAIDKFNKLNLFDEIIPISALNKVGTDGLLPIIETYIPESEFFYDAEMLSSQPERFFVAEIIRKILYEELRQEIPYSSEVIIAEFKERQKGKWFINAEILIEKVSQKKIVVGNKGTKIRIIGEKARLAIEEHLQEQVYLELFIKVRDNWRDNPSILKSLGYSV